MRGSLAVRGRVILLCVLLGPLQATAEPALPVPAGVQAVGVPPIPLSLVKRAEPYTKFRSSTLLDWHPAAPFALVSTTTQLSPVGQLQLVAASSATPELVIEQSERVVAAKFQTPHGSQALVRTIAADGKASLWLLDIGSRRFSRVSPVGESAGMGAWSSSGEHVVFTTSAPRSKLYVVNPRQPDSIKVVGSGETVELRDAQFSPSGSMVAYVRREAGEDGLWLYDIATTKHTKVKQGAPSVRYGSTQFSADGSGLWLVAARTSTPRQLVYLDIGTGVETTLMTNREADVIEFAISAAANRIAVNCFESGSSVLRFFDLVSRKELLRPALLPGEITGIRWVPIRQSDPTTQPVSGALPATNAGAQLGFSLASSRAPRDLFVYDAQTTKLVRWTNGAVPGLNAFEFIEPTAIRWQVGGDDERSADLFLPDTTRFPGARPVLIVLPNEIAVAGNGAARPRGFIGRYQFLLTELGIAICFPSADGKHWDEVATRTLVRRVRAHERLNGDMVIMHAAPAAAHHVLADALAPHPAIAGGIFVGGKSSLPPLGGRIQTFVVRETNEPPRAGVKWQISISDKLENANSESQQFVFYAQLGYLQTIARD